jgi:hypothetical protein
VWRRCTPCALGTHPRLVTIVRLAAVPRLTAQQSGTLGITFDRRLDDAWAELEALNTFVGYASDLEIRFGPVLAQSGIADRCELRGGDFFDAVPVGDACILRHVLHNWDDAPATAILANSRRAVMDDGKVLVIERAIAADSRQDLPSLLLDLQMLVMLGGRERTEAEYRTLFAAAGLEVRTVVRFGDPPQCTLFEGAPN